MSDISLFLNNLKTKPFFKPVLIAFIFLFALFLISFLIFLSQKPAEPEPPPPPSLPAAIIPSDQKVAQVGKETIYFSDLLAEASYYPQNLLPDREVETLKKLFLPKITEDSLTLQKAAEKGFVNLDETVFDSPNKDYKKRIGLVDEAKEAIQAYEGRISGESIAIWCYNVYKPKIGVEKAKEIAKEKIEKLYQDLKAGKITIKEAGEIIRNDSSLADIDPQYKTNAYQKFENLSKDKPYYFSDEANKILWSLKEGEFSPILTIKDTNADGQIRDSLFLIIKITKKEGKF